MIRKPSEELECLSSDGRERARLHSRLRHRRGAGIRLVVGSVDLAPGQEGVEDLRLLRAGRAVSPVPEHVAGRAEIAREAKMAGEQTLQADDADRSQFPPAVQHGGVDVERLVHCAPLRRI